MLQMTIDKFFPVSDYQKLSHSVLSHMILKSSYKISEHIQIVDTMIRKMESVSVSSDSKIQAEKFYVDCCFLQLANNVKLEKKNGEEIEIKISPVYIFLFGNDLNLVPSVYFPFNHTNFYTQICNHDTQKNPFSNQSTPTKPIKNRTSSNSTPNKDDNLPPPKITF